MDTSQTTQQRIGFIGIGMMGFPMASLLHKANYSLTIFDTNQVQAARFVEMHQDVVVAEQLDGLRDVDVVVTMLPNSNIVDEVVLGKGAHLGLVDILTTNATVIDMSSSQPLRSRALAEQLSKRGLHFLDAPVSGGVKRAIDGTLSIMVGGDAVQFRRHNGIFQVLGKAITHVGDAGAGHAMKALNNYVSAAGLVAVCEALLAGQQFGLNQAAMVDVLNNSTGKNNTTENKAKQFMLSGTFDANFAMQLMAKDLGIAMQLGASLGQTMVIGKQVLALWQDAVEALSEGADHTEMYQYIRQLNGPSSDL